MINILISASGKEDFFKDSMYPRLLFEINGRTMLQQIVDEYANMDNKRYIFTFLNGDCQRFHFDKSARLITDDNCDIVKINEQTGGALCSCLMCIEYIQNDDELIISNFDQTIEIDYNEVLAYFRNNNADAGVISFENFHPRWSYIRTEADRVIESASKTPISKNAIAGFYYFRHGCDYVDAAKKVILKGKIDESPYYVADSLNELILENKKILYFSIDKAKYHTFRILEDIKKYEARNR